MVGHDACTNQYPMGWKYVEALNIANNAGAQPDPIMTH